MWIFLDTGNYLGKRNYLHGGPPESMVVFSGL